MVFACNNCGEPALKACGRCQHIAYCSEACQKEDFQEHDAVCVEDIAVPWRRKESIADIVVSNPMFERLQAAVAEARIADSLKRKGPYTLLAPTNEAFQKLPQKMLAQLLDDRSELRNLLFYHVISGSMSGKDIIKMGSSSLLMLNGYELPVSVGKRGIVFGSSPNAASIVGAEIKAKNGLIHAIDRILIPPNLDLLDI